MRCKVEQFQIALALALAMGSAFAQPISMPINEPSIPILVLDRWADDCPTCISYSLEIYADGRVIHRGTTEWLDIPVRGKEVNRGTIETAIEPRFVKEWVDRLNELGFSSLPEHYLGTPCFAKSDMQRIKLRSQVGYKSLTWQVVCGKGGAIEQIDALAGEIRGVIKSEKLMKRIPDVRIPAKSPYTNY